MFKLVANFEPSKEQRKAIDLLVAGVRNGELNQTLLGITGSGKTFTIANCIAELNLPTLVIAPNKVLAAQLFEEFKQFFPENCVEYFVSYYDYYRPEAYIPHKGIYIEKEASINDKIDQLRHKATKAIIERKDVIVVASVSCIYGIGSRESYDSMSLKLDVGQVITTSELVKACVKIGYVVGKEIARCKIVQRGQIIWIGCCDLIDQAFRVVIEDNIIHKIDVVDVISRSTIVSLNKAAIFPTTHHVVASNLETVIERIQAELNEYLVTLHSQGKEVQAQRIQERVLYDIAQLKATNICSGIENYTRHFSGLEPDAAPETLFGYFNRPFLHIVDESHITVPQIGGMAAANLSRKNVLIDHGFRLPSARDNRPLVFDEWDKQRPSTIFVSATAGEFERQRSVIVEQIIRPTGLLDPECEIRPTKNQILDAITEAKKHIAEGFRVLMLTLTKKTAENVTEFLLQHGLMVGYLHGDLSPLERVQRLYDFRTGKIDILVGINLMREGIDIPECALICIFEADCAGFLRTTSSLIQMIGRVARNSKGKAILYADTTTPAMEEALSITLKRRELQIQYNKENNIIPTTIVKSFTNELDDSVDKQALSVKEMDKLIAKLESDIKAAVKVMDFKKAAQCRDRRNKLVGLRLKMD